MRESFDILVKRVIRKRIEMCVRHIQQKCNVSESKALAMFMKMETYEYLIDTRTELYYEPDITIIGLVDAELNKDRKKWDSIMFMVPIE